MNFYFVHVTAPAGGWQTNGILRTYLVQSSQRPSIAEAIDRLNINLDDDEEVEVYPADLHVWE